jgi:hypothetical protein
MTLVYLVLAVACTSPVHGLSPTPSPDDTFRITSAPEKVTSPPDENALALGENIVHDVELAEACHFDNPGCDPAAFARIRASIDVWKTDTGCTVTEIRIGASAETTPTKLENSGEARAVLMSDPEAGIGAAPVVIEMDTGVILLVPPLGKPATYFGVVVVADCSLHPAPGLGDGSA